MVTSVSSLEGLFGILVVLFVGLVSKDVPVLRVPLDSIVVLWVGLTSTKTIEDCVERSEVRVFDGLVHKDDLLLVFFGPEFEVVEDDLGFDGKT